MNYKKIYDQIIVRAKELHTARKSEKKQKLNYFEEHHVIPRCMGGDDSVENLVLLTGKEHFLCHVLLREIYPDVIGLKYAVWAMCAWKSEGQKRDYNISGRLYERIKSEMSKLNSARFLEKWKTDIEWRNEQLERRKKYKRSFPHNCKECDNEYYNGSRLPGICLECKNRKKARGKGVKLGQKRGPYKPKTKKFDCVCKYCRSEFKHSDVKCYTCPECKKPRLCVCGCNRIVKKAASIYATGGCKARGKTYMEIYGTNTPGCGFKMGKRSK